MPKKNYLKLNNIYKSKLLFQNKVFFCQIGKFGLTQFYSKKEGDLKTPKGKWEIGKFFYKKSSINYFNLIRVISFAQRSEVCSLPRNTTNDFAIIEK